ncbi:hypothetical protein [Mucilaginibacter terrae]|uniref:hypothetical protein n=1 Tax=Mucilaginibacter terrae TaxID=1955052 RepID=UPI00366BA0B5
MKPIMPLRFLLPIGLLLMAASFILKRFVALPHFANGTLMGVGIGIIFLSLVYYANTKQKL